MDRLRGRLVPFALCFFPRIASTNTAAAELLSCGALCPPALVVAGHQTAGRGQRGRTWYSSPHSLAATFVLRADPHRPIQQLPILVGLLVREALAGFLTTADGQTAPPSSADLKVKWPNDILLEGRKVAGILCERKQGADILGIGVNVRHDAGQVPRELNDTIISLAQARNAPDRWQVLAAIAAGMRERVLEQTAGEGWRWALRTWPEHDALGQERIEAATPGGILAGTACGIDEIGCLRIETPEGITAIASGTVRIAASR